MFEGIIGSIVWALANVLYIDMRRKGRSGLARIILFFMGNPLTWVWLFTVREGSAPDLVEPPDDAEAILAEIRRDRQLESGTSEDGTRDDDESPPQPGGGLSFFGS